MNLCTLHLSEHLKLGCRTFHCNDCDAQCTINCLPLVLWGWVRRHSMLTTEDIFDAEQHSSLSAGARGFRTVNNINSFSRVLATLLCKPKTRQKAKLKMSCFSGNVMNATLPWNSVTNHSVNKLKSVWPSKGGGHHGNRGSQTLPFPQTFIPVINGVGAHPSFAEGTGEIFSLVLVICWKILPKLHITGWCLLEQLLLQRLHFPASRAPTL